MTEINNGQRTIFASYLREGAVVTVYGQKHKWPGWMVYIKLKLEGRFILFPKHCTVESWLSNKHIIQSRLDQKRVKFERGAFVHDEVLPCNTTINKLINHHHHKIQYYLKKYPQITLCPIKNFQDFLDLLEYERQLDIAYRREVNYVADDELKQILGARYPFFAEKIRKKIDQMTATQPFEKL